MRSILRFLCVVVMLQVSTPLMHGMAADVEAGEAAPLLAPTYGERVNKVWPSANLKKCFRYKCTKVMCAILAAGAIAGCAYPFVNQLLQKDPAAIPLISKCPVYAWDRSNVSCSSHSALVEAIAACQAERMGGDAVPVCNDFYRSYEFPVGSYEKLMVGNKFSQKECAGNMNLTADDYLTAIALKPLGNKKLDKVRIICWLGHLWDEIWGVAIPHSLSKDIINFPAYEEQIVGHAEDMKGSRCKIFADAARKEQSCYGPITYNANSTSNAHSTKPKKNDASKRTKRKRRT